MADTAWLAGAAPAFDEGVLEWLTRKGVAVRSIRPEPVSGPVVPLLTAHRRRAAYRKRLDEARTLVLPYLAGDSLLLSALPGKRTLGVAVGSDVLRRRRSLRHERVFRTALRGFSAVWCVSLQLADELEACGRRPDWVSPIGVEIAALPSLTEPRPERGRIFSARRQGAVYRHDWIRAGVAAVAEATLIEAGDWPRGRMLEEYARAEITVSLAETDGAPATVMEALCLGGHVVASGGRQVREWLAEFGGTYGEPSAPDAVAPLLRAGLLAARAETGAQRLARAQGARDAFGRDRALAPLGEWLRGAP